MPAPLTIYRPPTLRPPARFLRAATAALLLCALLAVIVAPQAVPAIDPAPRHHESVAPRGASASLPVLNERNDRPAAAAGREFCLTVPPGVLQDGPVVFGTIVLPVREEPTLRSCFVYTQTVSSRL